METSKDIKNNQKHVCIINDLFSYLNKNTPYVVLRNYQKLPYYYGNDVDLLIDRINVEAVIKALYDITSKHQCKIQTINKKYCYYGVYIDIGDKTLLIDLFTDIVKGWIRYADSVSVLKNRKQYNNFYVPIIEHEISIIVLKELLTYKTVRYKYNKYLINNTPTLNYDIFFKILERYINHQDINLVWQTLLKGRVCVDILTIKPTIKNALKPIEFFKWLFKNKIFKNRHN